MSITPEAEIHRLQGLLREKDALIAKLTSHKLLGKESIVCRMVVDDVHKSLYDNETKVAISFLVSGIYSSQEEKYQRIIFQVGKPHNVLLTMPDSIKAAFPKEAPF